MRGSFLGGARTMSPPPRRLLGFAIGRGCEPPSGGHNRRAAKDKKGTDLFSGENRSVPLLVREVCAARGVAARAARHACAVEREQPDAVAARRVREERARRERDDVLLAVALERADGRVDAGVGLEFPQLLAVRLVERAQAAVVAADEEQPAGGHRRACVTELAPLLPPRELV